MTDHLSGQLVILPAFPPMLSTQNNIYNVIILVCVITADLW